MQNNYIKALDGIRFLAVTMVLVEHWTGDAIPIPIGYLGVCLFFVLSGFLITRILLNAKEQDEKLNRGHGFSLRQFYIRRTIRIFPVYYLTIFILFILNIPPVREKIVWCLTYSTNIYIAIYQTWLGSIDHLWSLAVEEQFYLFFPFVILFIPRKYLIQLLVILIVASVSLRAIFFASGASWIPSYVLMPTSLDAFGLGGLLAYFAWKKNDLALRYLSSFKLLLFSLVTYLAIVQWANYIEGGHNFVFVVLLRFFEAFFSLALIANITFSSDELQLNKCLKKVFSNSFLVYIGKISYGIYVYHNFVFNFYHSTATHPTVRLWNKLIHKMPFLDTFIVFKLVYLFVIVVAVASISWFLIEKPINNLKNRFEYK